MSIGVAAPNSDRQRIVRRATLLNRLTGADVYEADQEMDRRDHEAA